MVRERCPNLFAAQPVFVAALHLQRMAKVIEAIESVEALPAYQEEVLAAAPEIARLGYNGPLGAFLGYDFHLNQGHLGLIEINTNAGGAMLNAVLALAQRACCAAIQTMEPTIESLKIFEQRVVDMFRREWRLASRAAYRGDKLTRRAWQDILGGNYVAQAIVAPGDRQVAEHDASKTLKFDLRAYAYNGAVQWVAARLYQGQTTNFRTPGGGFAPVYSTSEKTV
jgi:hypothetical protein